ncbi:MAG TPA: hypothetical protein VM198_10200 [Longimicrobiales bacterium]|nr:hypothetical protein [Longimicrobiales bacterium]
MSSHSVLSTIAAIVALGLASPALAQDRSAVSGAELDAAVLVSTAQGGEAVRQFLSTEQVQKVADELGVSATELSASVAAVDNATLARLAQQGGLDEQDLAGGANTIVLSTTAVIIILLILILIT